MGDDNRKDEAVVPFDVSRRRQVERLYREHWRSLCARLRRVFGDGPPDPEDLAQTAFQKLIEQDALDAIRNPGGFLFTVAVNKGRDGQRHIARTERLLREEGILLKQDGMDQITPLNVYESRAALSATTAAIARLSAKQQEILARSRLKGETFDAIRAATGWSKADISRQLAAALKALNEAACDAADANISEPSSDE